MKLLVDANGKCVDSIQPDRCNDSYLYMVWQIICFGLDVTCYGHATTECFEPRRSASGNG